MFQASPNSGIATPSQERGITIMGQISTYQRCPVCGEKFKRVSVSATFTDLGCPTCKTKPTRLFLDFGKPGQRYIPRDEYGRLLSSVDMANALLGDIRRHGKIDPSKFVTRKKEPYRFENVVYSWLKSAQDCVSQGDMAPGTWEVKKRLSRGFLEAFGQEDIRNITDLMIERYRLSLPGSANYRRLLLSQLRNIFAYAKTLKMISEIPRFVLPGIPEQTIPTLSEKDQERVLSHSGEHRPIFEFGCLTGCRPSMARALQWRDVDFKEEVITFRHNFSGKQFTGTLKNRKPFRFPLIQAIKDLLEPLPRSITGFVFVNPINGQPYGKHLEWYLRKGFERAGLPLMPVKNFFRHSWANQRFDEGWLEADVADLLGNTPQVLRKNYKKVNVRRLGEMLERQKYAESGFSPQKNKRKLDT